MYRHALFIMSFPMQPFFHIFVTILTFLGLFPPQMVRLWPVLDLEMLVYEL